MGEPLVTIVTPSLNQGRFLRAAIESVLAQEYPNIEYLIMDGGSTDETAAIAADYAGRLRFISEPDRGQSDAINKGFRLAKGEIVAWLNADDLILPGSVGTAVRALETHPEAGAVYGEGYRMNEDGGIVGRFPFTEPFNLWKLTYVTDYILQQTVYLRKRVLDEVGYLDETLHYAMDWDLLIRTGWRRPLHYIPEYMGAIREHPAAKSFTGGRRRLKEIARVLRRHTGRRYPPGLLLQWLERYRHGALAPLAGRWADRIRRQAQGLYRDGWVGPRLRYSLPPGGDRLLIRGLSPAGQRLRVSCNGRPRGEFPVGPGSFEIRLETAGRLQLEIRARRSFSRPSEQTAHRRLCWVLQSIRWA